MRGLRQNGQTECSRCRVPKVFEESLGESGNSELNAGQPASSLLLWLPLRDSRPGLESNHSATMNQLNLQQPQNLRFISCNFQRGASHFRSSNYQRSEEHLKQEVWSVTAHSWPPWLFILSLPEEGLFSFQSFWALEGLWREKGGLFPSSSGPGLGQRTDFNLIPQRARLRRLTREVLRQRCPETRKRETRESGGSSCYRVESVSIRVRSQKQSQHPAEQHRNLS